MSDLASRDHENGWAALQGWIGSGLQIVGRLSPQMRSMVAAGVIAIGAGGVVMLQEQPPVQIESSFVRLSAITAPISMEDMLSLAMSRAKSNGHVMALPYTRYHEGVSLENPAALTLAGIVKGRTLEDSLEAAIVAICEAYRADAEGNQAWLVRQTVEDLSFALTAVSFGNGGPDLGYALRQITDIENLSNLETMAAVGHEMRSQMVESMALKAAQEARRLAPRSIQLAAALRVTLEGRPDALDRIELGPIADEEAALLYDWSIAWLNSWPEVSGHDWLSPAKPAPNVAFAMSVHDAASNVALIMLDHPDPNERSGFLRYLATRMADEMGAVRSMEDHTKIFQREGDVLKQLRGGSDLDKALEGLDLERPIPEPAKSAEASFDL